MGAVPLRSTEYRNPSVYRPTWVTMTPLFPLRVCISPHRRLLVLVTRSLMTCVPNPTSSLQRWKLRRNRLNLNLNLNRPGHRSRLDSSPHPTLDSRNSSVACPKISIEGLTQSHSTSLLPVECQSSFRAIDSSVLCTKQGAIISTAAATGGYGVD